MITCYTNDKVCKLSFLVPFCTFLLLTRMMMSMNINVGHDNVVYMTPWVDMSSLVFVWTPWSLHTLFLILFPVFLMNLSFAGSGFMGVYHLGVASCIKTYAPHILENKVPWRDTWHVSRGHYITRVQISGASAGAGVAVALVLGVPLGDMASDTLAGETSRMFVDSSTSYNMAINRWIFPSSVLWDRKECSV